MEHQRELLDQLMGAERNQKPDDKAFRKRKFYDDEVDKYYLCGCSPYELFKNTKSDLGPNPRLADEECKKQWDKLTQREKDKYGYEYETMMYLEKLVSGADKRVARHQQRVKDDERLHLESVARDIMKIEDEMSGQMEELQNLALKGEVEKAYGLVSMYKVSEKKRQLLLDVPEPAKKLIVCPLSGNMISSADNDDRIRSHFEGKQYRGWKLVRNTLEKFRSNPPPKAGTRRVEKPRSKSNTRSLSGSYSQSRSRRRTKDYEERSRSRRHRSRTRTHSRSKSVSRSRSDSRHKRSERDSKRRRDMDDDWRRDSKRDRKRERDHERNHRSRR